MICLALCAVAAQYPEVYGLPLERFCLGRKAVVPVTDESRSGTARDSSCTVKT